MFLPSFRRHQVHKSSDRLPEYGDRRIIALLNEARDPEELMSIISMAGIRGPGFERSARSAE